MGLGQVSSLAAQPHTTSSVRLTWESLSGASTYNVYYKLPAAGSWNKLSSITTVTENVTGLMACTSYTFKVAGSNASEGSCSSEVQCRTNCAHSKEWVDDAAASEDLALGATKRQSFAESIAVSEALSTALTPTRTLSDAVAVSEIFSTRKQQETSEVYVGTYTPTEIFQVSKFRVPSTDAELILCGIYTGLWENWKLHVYEDGLPTGYIETKLVDFGLPGTDKTLCEIQYQGTGPAMHTVVVSVSTDGGTTFTAIETRQISSAYTGFAFPWITAENFIVRFSGVGLYLNDITLKAVPAGEFDPDTATEPSE